MDDIIVQTPEIVTLVGASPAHKGDLSTALAYAPILVAADGGAEMVLNYGKTPKKIIGDFDSIDKAILAKIPVGDRHHVAEQDSTDFEKCLARIRAPLILGVGFLGNRLDHQMAAFNALVRNPGGPCILIGESDVVFHAPSALELTLAAGTRLSLFPMAPVSGRSKGLQWPIDGVDFAPAGRIGTSNRVVSGAVHLAFERRGMLVILPRAALGEAVRALAPAAPAR